MEVESQDAGTLSGTVDPPMDTQPDSSPGTFRLDITEPGYHPTLYHDQGPPTSPFTA